MFQFANARSDRGIFGVARLFTIKKVEDFDHLGFQLIIARSLEAFDRHPHGFGFIKLLEDFIRIVLLDRLFSECLGFQDLGIGQDNDDADEHVAIIW
jgi:hypothetical protein